MTRGDIDVLPIRGGYRIHKAERRRGTVYGSFSRAEAAALRLAEDHPEDAFVVTQEVARIERHRGGRS